MIIGCKSLNKNPTPIAQINARMYVMMISKNAVF
jgi:hypothetical protein